MSNRSQRKRRIYFNQKWFETYIQNNLDYLSKNKKYTDQYEYSVNAFKRSVECYKKNYNLKLPEFYMNWMILS